MTDIKPLEGVRVLDAATFLAAPFCGTILADFGADVIKLEQPGVGDPLRRFGTPSECGDTYVWLTEGRNKRLATLDLRKEEGASLFKELVRKSDVVLENFRPGTMQKWGLGYEELSRINPKIVMLSVSAYGQTGPYAKRPGFARIAHGFGGLSYLAGEPGRAPAVPGSTSLADYLSGMWGAIGVLIALRVVEQTGRGQIVDIALYESVFRVLDELVPLFGKENIVRERMGADVANTVPHSHYQAADGVWFSLACSSERMFQRLTEAMGQPELAHDPRYNSNAKRIEHREEVNRFVAEWMKCLSSAELVDILERHDVPAAPVYSVMDIFEDPQYAARGNLERIADPRVGELVLQSAMPRLSETPAKLRHAGAAVGADNEAIYGELLGLSREVLSRLQKSGVI